MKVLILGISGMLGHKAFEIFRKNKNYSVYGTLRSKKTIPHFANKKNIFSNFDAKNPEKFFDLIEKIKPNLIINCIGVISQRKEILDLETAIQINSLFPHKIAKHIKNTNIRLVQISTDCIFSGKRGNYKESDLPDAEDFYGKTKYLGELIQYENCLTLRTSIIGHEIKEKLSLLEWFLSQKTPIKGYTNAIYTGFTTFELVNIIEKFIIKNKNNGLFHLASKPISKYDLLNLIARHYQHDLKILKDPSYKSDKSLNASRFLKTFNYEVKSWDLMIKEMYLDNNNIN